MKKPYLLLLAIFIAFSSCEKDDICDPAKPTTPRLIIEFYDLENPSVLKNLRNLTVKGPDMEEQVIFGKNAAGEPIYISNANKIAIPLRALEDNTQLEFTLNSTDPNLAVTDILDFNYSRTTEYVSRACGFKTTFRLNPTSNALDPVVINGDDSLNKGNWIQNIEIVQSNINTENDVHLKILF